METLILYFSKKLNNISVFGLLFLFLVAKASIDNGFRSPNNQKNVQVAR